MAAVVFGFLLQTGGADVVSGYGFECACDSDWFFAPGNVTFQGKKALKEMTKQHPQSPIAHVIKAMPDLEQELNSIPTDELEGSDELALGNEAPDAKIAGNNTAGADAAPDPFGDQMALKPGDDVYVKNRSAVISRTSGFEHTASQ